MNINNNTKENINITKNKTNITQTEKITKITSESHFSIQEST